MPEESTPFEPFRSTTARLRCAHVQFKSLEAEIKGRLGQKPYTFRLENDTDTGEDVLKVDTVQPLPECWAVTAGGIIHNLRSALDNAIYDLTIAHSGAAVGTSAFPIYKNRKNFRRERDRKIGALRPECQTFIESTQPFNNPVSPNALWVMHELDIMDKHCTLPLVEDMMKLRAVNEFRHSESIEIGNFRLSQPKRLKPDTEIARWETTNIAADGDIDIHVEIERQVTLEIGTLIEGRPPPLTSMLHDIERIANLIFGNLRKFA